MKAFLLRLFPLLRSKPPLPQERIERVLLVGSGSAQNLQRAVSAVQERFPYARLQLVVPAGRRAAASGVWQYTGPGSGPRLRRQASAQSFDLKVVLFTGEGQVPLKLLAFALPARRMLVFTEGGGAFEWSFDQRLAIWNHITWRFGRGRPLWELLRRLVHAIVTPMLSLVAFVLLLLWHLELFVHRRVRSR